MIKSKIKSRFAGGVPPIKINNCLFYLIDRNAGYTGNQKLGLWKCSKCGKTRKMAVSFAESYKRIN